MSAKGRSARPAALMLLPMRHFSGAIPGNADCAAPRAPRSSTRRTQRHGMTDDPSTIELLQQGLPRSQSIAEPDDVQPELSFVRVPALYVEAFWFRYPEKL